jgi:starch phosphorylase
MSEKTRTSYPIYNFLRMEVGGFDSLAEPAQNLHWSWNHAAEKEWRQQDPAFIHAQALKIA